MEITRIGTQLSIKGPEDWFTGNARIDSAFQRSEPSRLTGAIVTFEPGARTAWHTHPLGQTLIVTSGAGWTQCEGEPRVEIHAEIPAQRISLQQIGRASCRERV